MLIRLKVSKNQRAEECKIESSKTAIRERVRVQQTWFLIYACLLLMCINLSPLEVLWESASLVLHLFRIPLFLRIGRICFFPKSSSGSHSFRGLSRHSAACRVLNCILTQLAPFDASSPLHTWASLREVSGGSRRVKLSLVGGFD